MLRKIAMTTAAFATFTLSAAAVADHSWWDENGNRDAQHRTYQTTQRGSNDGYVYAQVIDVEPIYRFIRVRTPQRECWDEQVRERPVRRPNGVGAATVAGGLIGGAIGNQFGDGNGRDALTVLGALIGSAVAHEEASRHAHDDYYYERTRIRTVERCTIRYTSREERRLEGYHVTYVYAGQKYATRMPRDPGDRIRVRVAVTPA